MEGHYRVKVSCRPRKQLLISFFELQTPIRTRTRSPLAFIHPSPGCQQVQAVHGPANVLISARVSSSGNYSKKAKRKGSTDPLPSPSQLQLGTERPDANLVVIEIINTLSVH